MPKPRILTIDLDNTRPHTYQILLGEGADPVILGIRGKPLSPRLSEDGYKQVKVKEGNTWRWKNVHRILAEEFIPNPENLSDVDHIDGDKLNNSLDNLQWMSREDNVRKALSRPCIALGASGFGFYFPSQASAKEKGYTQANISKVIKGERPLHKGFKWEDVYA